ncbi:hybrid sensor histidine kinase/response regulator [Piscinibacter sakaiensis]|uniref:hybrid sensor histidine kinase/response regulator n=1 Tax=Piscinibacter sakaiensis TaxID=1547922 RepID=UPI001E46C3E4|nr:response regulator [Piscinibacter sakaiensis]
MTENFVPPAAEAATTGRRDRVMWAAILALQLAVLAWDAVTPLGKTEWVTHLLPPVLTLFQSRRSAPLWSGALAIACLGLGFEFSATGTITDPTQALLNRLVGAVCVAVLSVVIWVALSQREHLRRQLWLRHGESLLGQRLVAAETPETLGAACCETLCRWLGADLGVLYRRDGAQLVPCGGHGVEAETLTAWLAVGEGLVGQVCADGRFRTLSPAPPGHLPLRTALGRSQPQHVVLMPLRAAGGTAGVIELGFAGSLPSPDRLEELAERIALKAGMALRGAIDARERQALLEETQRQAEELQAQQEELRVSNEELEEQGRVLRESQAELESQQSALEQSNAQLAVHARSLEQQKQALLVSQRDLAERGEALARANRTKSEFLANMSHELRTPLNSSLILSRLLMDNRDGTLSEEQVRFARTIHESNNDLLGLINEILDLAKIEAGHADLQPQTVRLAEVTARLRAVFEPLARQKGLGLTLALEDAAPATLETDPQRLQQVLRNLLANAIKFTARGEVTLVVRPGASAGGVRIDVADTGPGIPADKHEVIFEAFRQADGSTSRQFGGTGLGLSISRELVQRMGGRILLDSAPGRGSVFSVELPAQTPEAPPAADTVAEDAPGPAAAASRDPSRGRPPAAAAPASPARRAPFGGAEGPATGAGPQAPPAAAAAATGSGPTAPADARPAGDADGVAEGRRVLLAVEDDSRFAAVLRQLVEEMGFDCALAGSGEEALRLARELKPSGILLDVMLPDLSGLAVLERLKRDPATRHVPVHVVSSQERSQTALELGAVGHVVKPARREDLVAAIRRLEDKLDQPVRRVLVVEDDADLRDGLQRLLGGPTVEITTVGTVADALQALQRTTFDCMVTDLALPDASGFELLERMAADEARAFPPVIVYTGRALSRDEELRLRRHSRSIIVKGARSPERLLDEVTLFLHSVESQLPGEQQRLLGLARRRDAVLDGRTILLAEDDVRNVFALGSVFEPHGVRLEIARNGREALQKLQSVPAIDLVLMDVMMPEMDGLTAIRAIRERLGPAELPIIALTAKAMADDRQQCLEAGANDYLPKPIDVERLLSLCRVWMPK